MASLESFVTTQIERNVSQAQANLKILIDAKEKSSDGKFDANHAKYHVALKHLWESDGGKSIRGTYTGSISDAVRKAENKFYQENGSPNSIQARYFVDVQIGKVRIPVPETYYTKMKL